MDLLSNFLLSSSSSFITTVSFLHVLLFGMGIELQISCKSKSPSTCENWCFNFSLFVTPYDSTPFYVLGNAKNAFLETTLQGSTKLAMSTLELVQNGGVDVLSTMSSIRNMSFIFTKCEQQGYKKTMKNKRLSNLGP
jgi:hypothetical protein